jgi:hypothetical protein
VGHDVSLPATVARNNKQEIVIMRAKTYVILCRCIEQGIERGYDRAHKHTDTPDENALKKSIEDNILLELDEVFDFDTTTD